MGTLLVKLKDHQLHLTCRSCGHTGKVIVAEILERGYRAWTTDDVLRNARCSKCRSRTLAGLTISWSGASHKAMTGARSKDDEPKP